MRNPEALITMQSGAEILIELLPDVAPNTVSSFIYLAELGCFDDYAIRRIVPGKWVDVSFNAFGRDECKYLIPRESELHPELEPLESLPGCVCMGGYEDGLAGGEFFFPLKSCPEHRGVYPVFGRVISGFSEIERIASVKTEKAFIPGYPDVELNVPLEPQIIKSVKIKSFGQKYKEPVKLENRKLPECWK